MKSLSAGAPHFRTEAKKYRNANYTLEKVVNEDIDNIIKKRFKSKVIRVNNYENFENSETNIKYVCITGCPKIFELQFFLSFIPIWPHEFKEFGKRLQLLTFY